MSLFQRRNKPEQLPQMQPEFEVQAQPEAVSAMDFVSQIGESLDASTANWSTIAREVADFQNDAAFTLVKDNLRYVYGLTEIDTTEDTLVNEATRQTKAYGTLLLLISRHKSGGGFKDIFERAVDHEIYDFSDTNIGFLQRNDKSSQKKLTTKVLKVANCMRMADFDSQSVTKKLVETYASQPSGLFELAQLYHDGVAEADPRFKELQELITTDWTHCDPSQSVLRTYCADLRDNPDNFVGMFAREVATAEQDKRMTSLQLMAKFAVAAASEKNLKLTVEEAISSTYRRWSEFSDVQSMFEAYVANRVTQLEAAFTDISATNETKSIRPHRSREDVEAFKRTMFIHYSGRRGDRREETKARARLKMAEPARLPSSEDIIEQAALAEAALEPRKIFVTKSTHQGVTLVETDLSEVSDSFAVKKGNGLERDVEVMIERLKKLPISPASIRIRSARGRINVGGNRINLWRFAPDDSPKLGIDPSNRYHRIVYGLKNRDLVIVDVLDHASFDKKYS